MAGLSDRGFNCIFILHDIDKNRFVFEGRDISNLLAFLCRHKVDALINQNGYSSQMTEALIERKWNGAYIVCHHSEPRFLLKINDLQRVASEIFNPKVSRKARLSWLIRFCGYPLWKNWSNHKIANTQGLNYERCDKYVLLSPSFLGEFSHLIARSTIPKAVAIPNPLSFEIDPDAAKTYTKEKVVLIARIYDREKRTSAALSGWHAIERQDREGWTLAIVGDGPEALTLQEKARQLDLK